MIQFPFFTMQQLNLDWFLDKVKTILRFMPIDSGNVGDVLQRNAEGAAWQPLGAATLDINGMTAKSPVDGADEVPIYDSVALENKKATVSDIVALASSAVTSVNGQTGAVSLSKSDVGLGNVANEAQYSASNPPPYPVTSVNGQTGAVIVAGGGAVDSVNGRTGTVVVADNIITSPSTQLTYGWVTYTGITNVSVNLTLLASDSKKYIRIGGKVAFTTGTPDEWKYIYLYKNNNLDPIDGYTYPNNTITRATIGVVIDENGDVVTDMYKMNFNVFINSIGQIWFAYQQPASLSSGLNYTVIIPSVELCTSL